MTGIELIGGEPDSTARYLAGSEARYEAHKAKERQELVSGLEAKVRLIKQGKKTTKG